MVAGAGAWNSAEILERVLDTARKDDFEGSSKHDALNARWLERLAGSSRPRRLVATQLVMRSPVDVRNLVGVKKARNAKGLSLFSRALLSRYRTTGEEHYAKEARDLLDWLIANPSPYTEAGGGDLPGMAWGYPYPWQDVGFFAPRNFANRIVSSFVGQALLDCYETLGDERYLDATVGPVAVPPRGAQDAVRGRAASLRQLRARPAGDLDRHGRVRARRRARRPATPR